MNNQEMNITETEICDGIVLLGDSDFALRLKKSIEVGDKVRAQLKPEIEKIKIKLNVARKNATSVQDKISTYNRAFDNIRRKVAIEVGIPVTYITNSGSLSKSKINKLYKKDNDNATKLLNLYNHRFVNLYNRALATIELKLTDSEKNANDILNLISKEYNALVRQYKKA